MKMENPNVLFTGVGVAELVDTPVPEVSAGQMRVTLLRSTISAGTERANVTGCNVVSIWDPPDAPVVWPLSRPSRWRPSASAPETF